MRLVPTSVPDVILIEPSVFADDRGFFMETFQADEFRAAGIATTFVQDNHSRSRQGVLRGLHYQIRQAQGKLVRVVAGEIFDVAVDLRKTSPTFGRWVGTKMSMENRLEIWIPAGLAHGFYALSDWADVLYKVTAPYAPEWERTLLWDDPQVGIEWPLLAGHPPILSPKDASGKPLSQAEAYKNSR